MFIVVNFSYSSNLYIFLTLKPLLSRFAMKQFDLQIFSPRIAVSVSWCKSSWTSCIYPNLALACMLLCPHFLFFCDNFFPRRPLTQFVKKDDFDILVLNYKLLWSCCLLLLTGQKPGYKLVWVIETLGSPWICSSHTDIYIYSGRSVFD